MTGLQKCRGGVGGASSGKEVDSAVLTNKGAIIRRRVLYSIRYLETALILRLYPANWSNAATIELRGRFVSQLGHVVYYVDISSLSYPLPSRELIPGCIHVTCNVDSSSVVKK